LSGDLLEAMLAIGEWIVLRFPPWNRILEKLMWWGTKK
jgi:hypothetical protein